MIVYQDEISESLQLPGLVVVAVVPGSPAEKAAEREREREREREIDIHWPRKG